MKYVLTSCNVLLASVLVLAQAPQSFKYQAVLREKTGQLIIQRNVSVRISILQGTVSGASIYSETHAATTTSSGAINLEIGNGSQPVGTFTSIEWGKELHFVKIEMDPLGGTTYEVVGISQLLSVPYAMYAEKSGDEKWGKGTDGVLYHKDANKSEGKGRLELRSDTLDAGVVYATSLNRMGDTSEDLLFGLQQPIGNDSSWNVMESWRGAGLMISASGPDLKPLVLGIDRVEKARLSPNGNFGIGTSAPDYKLDVTGTVNASQYLLNGVAFPSNPWLTGGSNIYFTTGNVGIGTATPTAKLDIQGLDATFNIYKTRLKATESDGKGRLELRNGPTDVSWLYSTSLNRLGDSSEDLLFGLQQPIGNTTSWNIIESWRGAGLMVSASGPDLQPLTFGIDRVEKARFSPIGNFGIGTVDPKTKLQVENGDVYINSVTAGVIMKSPDGQCWRMTVNNIGAPVFSSISCP